MLPCCDQVVSFSNGATYYGTVVNQKVALLYGKRSPGQNSATQMNLTVLCFDNTLISLLMQTQSCG